MSYQLDINVFIKEVCEPEIRTDPLVERLNKVEKENSYLKEKLKSVEEVEMKLELHAADVDDLHKTEMNAMRLKIRKIRKYSIDNEACYHYVVESIVTLVATSIAFIVAFKSFT
uniref:Uncharacterized protein n=1 Tax=Hordeum vulgare subsp. vulgare TaxID=112509 RepID=A0A8I7B5Z9_HORVV